jgi:hypothetical protein
MPELPQIAVMHWHGNLKQKVNEKLYRNIRKRVSRRK